jgi:hypothetical protein
MTLIEHIKAENELTKQWVAAGPGRGAGLWCEDEKHWNELGVYTVEDFIKYGLKASIWDGFKDIHGVRPRHLDLDSMSIEELEAELKSLNFEEVE